jgi:integrase
MAHIKFYLRQCSDPELGVLNHWVLEGQKVLQRKSYGVKLPLKYWDVKNGRLSRKHPENLRINKMIDQVIESFNYQETIGGSGDIEEQCVLMLFQKLIDTKKSNGLSSGTIRKYETILNNFKEITTRVYGKDRLPIKFFREMETVQTIKQELLKSRRTEAPKSFKALKNYISRLTEVLKYWNATSGTQHEINTTPLNQFIGKDEQKLSRALSEDELNQFINYQPDGKRGGWVERIAKTFFLFQYFCGGTRIHDVLLLTNKSLHGKKMEVRVRKNKTVLHNPITLELAKCLEPLYPELFKIVFTETRMSKVKLKLSTAIELAKLQHPKNITSWNLSTLYDVENKIQKQHPEDSEIFKPYLDEAKEKLEQLVGEKFFEELSKGDEHFIFPYLDFNDFKETELDWGKFDKTLEDKIQRVRAKHNGALKRICLKLGIDPVSGHTPRHTVVRNFVMNGADDNLIKDVLGHSSLATTQHYLTTRHPLRSREEELREMYRRMRNKQTEN